MLETSSNKHFMHTWQLLGRDACGKGGPIITLDVYDGVVAINDQVRKCATCVSAPLGYALGLNLRPGEIYAQLFSPLSSCSLFFDRTIVHRMTVTYGPDGSIDYTATPLDSPEATLLSYVSRGRDTGDEGSVKVSRCYSHSLSDRKRGLIRLYVLKQFGSYRLMVDGLEPVTDYVGDCEFEHDGPALSNFLEFKTGSHTPPLQ